MNSRQERNLRTGCGAVFRAAALFLGFASRGVVFRNVVLLGFLLVGFCSGGFHGSLAMAQQKPAAPAGRKPIDGKPIDKRPVEQGTAPVEKLTDNLYRVGTAVVDTSARSVTCPGEVNMDSGAIEYLAVAPGGKLHESLLRVDVRPLHLQVALLLLGLQPKNVLQRQGDSKTPQGDPVEIRVRWKDRTGTPHDVRAEALIQETPGARPMPMHRWVFTGSRILKEGFQADLDKSLVAVWHDPAAILDNPLPGGANNAYIVNAQAVPRRGTSVTVVLKAVAPPAPTAPPTGTKGRAAGGRP